MSKDFNLNIYNYTNSELLDLLSIEKPYNSNSITWSCEKLKDKLFKDSSKTDTDKAAINGFLRQVKTQLLKDCPIEEPTTDALMIKSDSSVLKKDEYSKKEFVSTFPHSSAPKNLNPLKRRLIKKTLNVDTRFRSNYNITEATNIHLDLPTVIKNAVSMKLVGLELPPCPIYAINDRYGNNFFHETTDNGITWNLVTIPNGNYDLAAIIAEINTAITNANITANDLQHSCKINFTFTTLNDGVSFNRDINGIIEGNNQMKLGWILGFLNDEYIGTTSMGEAPYDPTGSKYLYLVVDDFTNNINNHFIGAFNESLLNQNILARLPLYNNNEEENNRLADDINNMAEAERLYFGPIDIQKLKIQLIDEYGRIVDLNKRDYSIALEFNCVYN